MQPPQGNLLQKQMDVPASSVPRRTPPHEMRGEDPKLRKVNAGSERVLLSFGQR
ncbi:MAG: hypothetical protein KIH08_16215 [Candidatus Freyarchaeota archaeon]|nr:hypothetical protein [Candidatus Jordarchaeia archaeon]MBS7270272.1 hypothetical protein [Candidatus Jordarchaeia archaeon]MBS7281017.1 hypothetical protein [Candidatus Jordarchaeia archaeon]